jgi:hypothetical protein
MTLAQHCESEVFLLPPKLGTVRSGLPPRRASVSSSRISLL